MDSSSINCSSFLEHYNRCNPKSLALDISEYQCVRGHQSKSIFTGRPLIVFPDHGILCPDTVYLRPLFSKKDVRRILSAGSDSNIYSLLLRREVGTPVPDLSSFWSRDDICSFVRYSRAFTCRECHSCSSDCTCDPDRTRLRISCKQFLRSTRCVTDVWNDPSLCIDRLCSPLSVLINCPVCGYRDCQCYYSGDDEYDKYTPPLKTKTSRKFQRASMRAEKYTTPRHYLKEALNKARSPINHLSLQGKDYKIDEYDPTDLELQALTKDMNFDQIVSLMSSMSDITREKFEELIKLLEDVALLVLLLKNANSRSQIVTAWVTFIKLRTKRSLCLSIPQMVSWVADLLPTEWIQSHSFFQASVAPVEPLSLQVGPEDDKIEEWLKFSRSLVDGLDNVSNSPLYRKFHKFLTQCFTHSIFVGGDVEKLASIFLDLEAEAYKNSIKSKGKFGKACLDLITFLLERGYQCVKLGSITPIFHSCSTYDTWLSECQDIIGKAPYISNPEVHGFTMSTFLAKLDELIEQGDSIVKLALVGSKLDHKFVNAQLAKIKHIRNNTLTKKAAMQDRRAPLGILIHGSTSVGKSLFSYLIFQYYGKLFGLPTTPEYRYTRDGRNPYWVNFNSSQWCVHCDDIASMRPDKCPQGDLTVTEILLMLNNICFVPLQADIDDKGKTPLIAELVIATTNTEHLNLAAYYQCPEAAARRFPWVITIVPKKEHQTDDGRLKPSTCGIVEEGSFPDLWNVHVRKTVISSKKSANSTNVSYVPLRVDRNEKEVPFSNIYDFLEWFRDMAKAYRVQQDNLQHTQENMFKTSLCEKCELPELGCKCSVPQTPIHELYPSTTCPICFKVGCNCDEIAQEVKRLEDLEESVRFAEIDAELYPEDNILLQGGDTPEDAEIIKPRWDLIKAHSDYINKSLMEAQLKPRNWLLTTIIRLSLYLYLRIGMLNVICYVLPIEILYSLWCSTLGPVVVRKAIMHQAARKAESIIGVNVTYANVAKGLCGALVTGWVVYSLFHFSNDTPPPKKKEEKVEDLQSKDTERRVKAHADEQVNVYRNDDYQTTTFDVSRTTMSWKGLPESQVISEIAKNVVHIEFSCLHNDYRYKREGMALCVRGNLYVCNNHVVTEKAHTIRVIQQAMPNQPSTDIVSPFDVTRVYRIPESDMAFFEILHIPPKKDITKLFSNPSFRGNLKAQMIIRDELGNIRITQIARVANRPTDVTFDADDKTGNPAYQIRGDTWQGIALTETKVGECGSPYVSFTPMGPVILGIHYGGGKAMMYNTVACNHITSEDIANAISRFDYTIAAAEPVLSAQSRVVELGPLHPKCPLRWFTSGNAMVFGSIAGHRASPKSRVASTPIAVSLLRRGWKVEHGPPVMKGWEPIRKAIAPLLECSNKMDPRILRECKEHFLKDILDKLTPEDLEDLHPVDTFDAVNGVAGVAFFDGIKRPTSAGAPWRKSKKFFYHSIPPQRGLQDPIEFDDEIMERVHMIEERYRNGERWMPIFTDSLKDEPVSVKKIKEKKTRVFSGAPIDFLIVGRKLYMTLCRLMCNKRLVFELAVGTNCMSKQWTDILNHLIRNDPKLAQRMIAGDFGNFDKSMFSFIILLAFEILIDICKKSGNFNEEDIRSMRAYAVDTAYALHDLFNDLVMFFGGNPSGHLLTVFINSLANSLYMRYVFAVNSPDGTARDFQRYVHLITYGDDNAMSVEEDCHWFNHTIIRDTLASVGIVYTMADKEAESIPFIPLDDVSFLKRRWVWSEDLNAYAAPIEEKSIRKALMCHVVSKTDDVGHQTVSATSSSAREYFMYGREKYNEMCSFFKEILLENDLGVWIVDSTFPSYNELLAKFQAGKMKTQAEELAELAEQEDGSE